MNHDTDERLDGLDDALRERLHHLGRAATAGALPWPGVDRAIRRRRRTAALRTGAVAAAAIAVGTATALAVAPLGGSVAPARDGVTRSPVPPPPWMLPASPYTSVYQGVRTQIDVSTCGRSGAVNLREPARVGTIEFDVDGKAGADLSVGRPCFQPEVTVVGFGVPNAMGPERPAGSPVDAPPDAAECFAALRSAALAPDVSYSFSPRNEPIQGCALLPADPQRDLPALLVSVRLTKQGDQVDLVASAWTGGGSVAVTPPQATAPTTPTVAGPYREKYRDVTLRLPGRPEACAAAGQGTFLDVNVPEVNDSLGLSDAMLTPPCSDTARADLQLGDDGPGAVVRGTDVSAADCEAALHGRRVNTFAPVAGTTLCLITNAREDVSGPEVLLVALTVTAVNAETGAFDLSATAWTGTGTV